MFLGNLHAGNIFIGSDGNPIISETEHYFNGSTSILRPFIVQLKGPCSNVEALDVYCFGHFLFEMATGSPLQNPTCDNALPSQMPEQLSKSHLKGSKCPKLIVSLWGVEGELKSKLLSNKTHFNNLLHVCIT